MVMPIGINSGDLLTVEQLNSHFKVLAGPGAGKTHFLTENIKNIVTTYSPVAQSKERKVLCVTYTNAAVNEIKHRLDRFSSSVEIYTIHGFIIEHIIKPFQNELRKIMLQDFEISVSDTRKISSQIEAIGILHGIDKTEIFDFVKTKTGEDIEMSYSKKIMGEVEIDIDKYISTKTNKIRASKRIASNHILPIKEYTWSKAKKLTHNEILYFGYRILQQNNIALYTTRVKFPIIFIDEFQDTNPLQTMLMQLIGAKTTVVGAIGDVAQSIYGFQGAKPSQFRSFHIEGERSMCEYKINGNRRSTKNIVNFCNFLRKSDPTIYQNSDKTYKNDEEKQIAESTKVHIISGHNTDCKQLISTVMDEGGVVLTRTWVAAFSYIQNISKEQELRLNTIYSSYYTSPVDIRNDIIQHNQVTWVRAFRFVFKLWNGYKTGALVEIVDALALVTNLDVKILTPKVLFQLKKLTEDVFKDISEASLTVTIIDDFCLKLFERDYDQLLLILGGKSFVIPIFDEEDRDEIKDNVPQLTWSTSYKLFTEVFSENSRYMTVHQAKGQEWEKVIVSLEPNSSRNRDNITLSGMFANPQLLNEENAQEFTRMYYVACSRAKRDLYIHLKNSSDAITLMTAVNDYNQSQNASRKIEADLVPC